jgi:hypothetical protein
MANRSTSELTRAWHQLILVVGLKNNKYKTGTRWRHEWSLYSYRRGGSQSALLGGMGVQYCQLVGGWSSSQTVEIYHDATLTKNREPYTFQWPAHKPVLISQRKNLDRKEIFRILMEHNSELRGSALIDAADENNILFNFSHVLELDEGEAMPGYRKTSMGGGYEESASQKAVVE